MEPTTYCGASGNHVHYNNHVLNEEEPIKLFGRDEICEDTTWLDMKNCSGTIHSKTFSLLPKLEFINLTNCNIQKIENDAFAIFSDLKSIDVRESIFPITTHTFDKSTLKSIYLGDLEIKNDSLSSLKHLEDVSFENCTFTVINNLTFSEFSSLETLTFSCCQISTIECGSFDHLNNNELRFMNCKIQNIDFNCFSNLSSLKYLSFYGNSVNSTIKYEVFKNLSLENIFFDLNVYKDINFSEYPKLKTVRLGFKDAESEKAEELLRNEIISKLDERNIGYELVSTGKIEVDMDDVQICC